MFHRRRQTAKAWMMATGAIFLVIFLAVIGRFVYITQAKSIDGHNLLALGRHKWQAIKLVDEKRGTIYSENGQILAEDIPAYTLYAVVSPSAQNRVRDKGKTAAALAPILNMSTGDVLTQLNRQAYQVQFGTKGKMLSHRVKEKIEQLKLPGLFFQTESKRYYPEQSSAAYVLGFTGMSGADDEQKGVYGIEQSLNPYLTERDGSVRYYRSLKGVPIPDEKQKIVSKAYPGDDVYLTLNTQIQTVLDQAMAQVQNDYKPTDMVGVVADPKTGKILAMSSYPSFNPNLHNIKQYADAAIADPYEPGSVMKVFTVASAFDSGTFNTSALYNSGSYQTNGGTIHDWDKSGWGMLNFSQAFELSSNVGMSVLADKYLGTDRLHQYLQRFGFMKKTGIDLPDEGDSRVNWRYKIDQLEASFGQASAFTAMQIVQAATAIANNGTMVRPYIVNKIVNPETNSTVLKNKTTVVGHPISAAAAEQTRALMRQVVTDHHVVGNVGATGLAYDLPGYDVIGKTGTAQIGSPTGYLTGKNNYIYSFLGMAPQKNPRLIVYVAVKQPQLKDTDLGSEPVVAIVRPVMTSALQYLQAAKEISEGMPSVSVPSRALASLTGQSMAAAAQQTSADGFSPVAVGSGTLSAQMPYAGEQLIQGSRVILYSAQDAQFPDVSGWSLADVMKLAQVAGVKLNEQGEGYVRSQSPAAGTPIHKGDTLAVELADSGEK
ncbi:MAG: penicillin-binding transpeptidase domain-containing protein [Sporolactobacillus sp.]